MLTHLRRIAESTGTTGHFRRFLLLTVLSALSQALIVLMLFPVLRAVFTGRWSEAGWWVLAMALTTTAVWLIDRLAATSGLELGIAIMRAIEIHGPRAVRALPVEELRGRRLQRLRTTLANTGANATSSVVLILTPLIVAVIHPLVLALGLAVTVSWILGLTALLVAVLLGAAFILHLRTELAAETTYDRAVGELDDRLFEFAWLQPTLRTAGRTADAVELVEHEITAARSATMRLLTWQIPGELAFRVALQAGLLVLAAVTWFSYSTGAIDGVTAAAMIVVLLRVVEQFTAVSQLTVPVLASIRGLAEVRELVDLAAVAPAPQQPTDGPVLVETTGLAAGIIGDAEFTLAPGTVTVIVGRSGSGKTTLLKTLAGLRAPQAGEIRVNGRATTEVDRQALSAVVLQDTQLNDGTIAENILVAADTHTRGQLPAIVGEARLGETLERLSAGQETTVGELGSALSGGERQRVGIARALAKKAPLLLIDEATSALDAVNEAELVDTLGRVRERATTVIVSHRPAVLRIADQVLVMADGVIVEQGSPEELAAAGGEFADFLAAWGQALRDSAAPDQEVRRPRP